MHEIGLMQGRLVPQVNGRIQAFPKDHWREEFMLAQQHEFASIEFIFEADDYSGKSFVHQQWTRCDSGCD